MLKRNSTNDYLERILILHKDKGFARSVDLARELGVTKPTVCNALKRMCDRELIAFNDRGHIVLTETGKSIAQKVHKKHKVLTRTLIGIGVDESVADKDASLMEHVISEETYKCLTEFYNTYPRVSES